MCVFPLVRSGACRGCRRTSSRGCRPRPPQTPAAATWGSPHSTQGAVESPDLSFHARAVAQFTEPSTEVVVGRGGSNCSGSCPARLGHFDRPLGARCHFKTLAVGTCDLAEPNAVLIRCLPGRSRRQNRRRQKDVIPNVAPIRPHTQAAFEGGLAHRARVNRAPSLPDRLGIPVLLSPVAPITRGFPFDVGRLSSPASRHTTNPTTP